MVRTSIPNLQNISPNNTVLSEILSEICQGRVLWRTRMNKSLKFDQRLFFSKKGYCSSNKAKADVKTHPNVLDLESMQIFVYHNNHKTLVDLHTSRSNVRAGKESISSS